MTISALLSRLETATEADQAKVLEIAFHELIPMPKVNASRPALPLWHDCHARFCHMMEARAYESAALLILREVLPGWNYMLGCRNQPIARAYVNNGKMQYIGGGVGRKNPESKWYEFTHCTPALAIIAAICAAKGEQT